MIEVPNRAIVDELEYTVDNNVLQHEHIGNPLEETPSSDITRIYVQNLNGLRWDKDGGQWPYICDAMSSAQVDIACFSETNTNTNKYSIRSAMEKACKRQFNHSRLVMAASLHKTTHDYKPGGTAILACNDISANIRSHTRD